MPFLINGLEVDMASPPSDRAYRGAWVLEGEVVKVDPAKAAQIAIQRIGDAARDKRRELASGKPDAHDLKGALALNAKDDSRPIERDEARAVLDAYAKARGDKGWREVADKIITARNAWTNRMMALEIIEDGAWRALQSVKSGADVATIEAQAIEAIGSV